MPQVSVLIPAYIDNFDKVQWLGEALESVRGQSFNDWECLIVDDSSPIPFDEIKAKYQDRRFRWFRAATNQGPARCRNTAAALAEAEAIIALDADDQLGTSTTLERLYNAWAEDKKKIIYGNLQRYRIQDGNFVKDKLFSLGEYSMERVMDLNGLFPVTALHSIEAHRAAGGWKPHLEAGLEDVEYWISAAERGFCGLKINHTTLVYRIHEGSRNYSLRHISNRENEMRAKIVDLHKDIYEGKYPMGCCGGKSTVSAGANGSMTTALSAKVTTLDNVPASQKVWLQYVGPRQARFDIFGRETQIHYTILGTGHRLEVHIHDVDRFKSLSRGRDFKGVAPAEAVALTEERPIAIETELPPAPTPELATIERLDQVAARSREIEAPPAPPPEPAPAPQPEPQPEPTNGENYDLGPLGLSASIQQQLEAESWSIERIANSRPEELMPYQGIGAKRAQAIIQSAQRLV